MTHHPAFAESEGEKTSGVLTQSWRAGAAVGVAAVVAVMIVVRGGEERKRARRDACLRRPTDRLHNEGGETWKGVERRAGRSACHYRLAEQSKESSAAIRRERA